MGNDQSIPNFNMALTAAKAIGYTQNEVSFGMEFAYPIQENRRISYRHASLSTLRDDPPEGLFEGPYAERMTIRRVAMPKSPAAAGRPDAAGYFAALTRGHGLQPQPHYRPHQRPYP
jgi:hypothetical protein